MTEKCLSSGDEAEKGPGGHSEGGMEGGGGGARCSVGVWEFGEGV